MDRLQLLDQMLEAIAEERAAVRKALGALEGQKDVPLRDGHRFVSEPGAHVYRFECDLDFLIPDGTRVQVQTPGQLGSGEVVDHDPALEHLGLLLREDLGEHVWEARLLFDPTFLLDLLTGHLQSLKRSIGPEDSESTRAIERAFAFLEGSASPKPPSAVRRSALSQSQSAAVSFVLGQEAAYLWGPPGTGKTQTVAHLVHELIERGDKVLLTAHTNVATDTALARVLREKRLPARSALRVGYVGEELRSFGVGLDEQLDRVLRDGHADLVAELEEFCARLAKRATRPPALLGSGRASLPRRFRVAFDLLPGLALMEQAEVARTAARLEDELARLERQLVDGASLVASTLTRLHSSRLMRTYRADTVVIDEASIASLVLAFVAACCARKRTIAVGDFMQLPAIVQAEQPAARRWLGRHVFASARCDRADGEHPLRAMLDEQWRMHPDISRVVSRVFYAGRLKDAPAVRERAGAGPALLLVDTSGLKAVSETAASGSKLNRVHAALVARLVGRAEGAEVAVIAPYRAQVRELREALREVARERLGKGGVEVFTVHRFQGRDRELVIFDLVEAPGTPGRFVHELHNPDAPNLINVAMSRAQQRLVVVAHLEHLAATLGRQSLVNRVIEQMRLAGALEVVAGDARDEAALEAFLTGVRHGDPRH